MSLVMLYSSALFSQPAGSNCKRAIFLPPAAKTCSQSTEHMPPKEDRRFFKFTSYSTAIEITVSKVLSGPDAEITKISALEGVCNNLNLLQETQQIINGKLTLKLEGLTPGQVCFIKAERVKKAPGNFEMCVKEMEEPLPFGLQHNALGNAILTEVNNTLLVSGIGPTGNDGVSINVGEANFYTETELSQNVPIGATMTTEHFAQVDGIANVNSLTIHREIVLDGVLISADFSGVGALTFGLKAFNEGVLVLSQSGISGTVGVFKSTNKRAGRCCWRGVNGVQYSFAGSSSKFTIDGGTTINADFILLSGENATKTTDFLSEIKIRGKNLSELTLTGEWIVLDDNIGVPIPHRSFGGANFIAANGDLTVSNIGTGGQVGVSIDFLDFLFKDVESFTYDVVLTRSNYFSIGCNNIK